MTAPKLPPMPKDEGVCRTAAGYEVSAFKYSETEAYGRECFGTGYSQGYAAGRAATTEAATTRAAPTEGKTMNNYDALGMIREARALLRDEAKTYNSRELAMVLTKLDEAELWLQRDMQMKAPTEAGCGD